MNEALLESVTTTYIKCPHCLEGKSPIDHLFSQWGRKSFGPWYCDECGRAYAGEVKGRDVFVRKIAGKKTNTLVFLRRHDVMIIKKGICLENTINHSNEAYYYNEHTCPTNYLGEEVLEIVNLTNMDSDPHGIFQYVTSIPLTDDMEEPYFQYLPKEFSNLIRNHD